MTQVNAPALLFILSLVPAAVGFNPKEQAY